MRSTLFRLLLSTGLGVATLAGTVDTVSAQPNVRDHRRTGPNDNDRNHDRDRGPREAPPAPRVERQAARKGYVWVSGHWDWQGGKWTWVSGRWERERPGKRWRAVRWELRGGVYVRVDGDWEDDLPRVAPPAPKVERKPARKGFVWIPGHWDWQRGKWTWVSGRYEAERESRRWRPTRWELRNGVYVRIDGDWEPDYPNVAPPPPKVERVAVRAGYVWVPGHWYWKNGKWEWYPGRQEKRRPGKRYREVTWELKNGIYVRIGGDWIDHDERPRQAPPALRDDTPRQPRRGYVWVAGHWDWKDGEWKWVSGRWEKERPGKRWRAPRWEQRNGVYVKIDGDWEIFTPASTPVPPPPPAASGPTSPPPAPRAEAVQARAGYVWARGHYRWSNGKYEWVPGHWERARANMKWQDPRWEKRGNVWVFVEGGWR